MAYVPPLPGNRPPVPGFDYVGWYLKQHPKKVDVAKALAERRFHREYARLRAERIVKHLPGLHNQKSHGNQFAKTPWLFDAIVPNLGPAFPDPHKWSAHVTSYANDPKYRSKFDSWYYKKAGKQYLPWSPLDEMLPPPVPTVKPPGSNAPEPPGPVAVAPEPKPDLMGQAEFKQALAQGPVIAQIELWSDTGHHTLTGLFEYDFEHGEVDVKNGSLHTAGSNYSTLADYSLTFGPDGTPEALTAFDPLDAFAPKVAATKPTVTGWKEAEGQTTAEDEAAEPITVTVAGVGHSPQQGTPANTNSVVDSMLVANHNLYVGDKVTLNIVGGVKASGTVQGFQMIDGAPYVDLGSGEKHDVNFVESVESFYGDPAVKVLEDATLDGDGVIFSVAAPGSGTYSITITPGTLNSTVYAAENKTVYTGTSLGSPVSITVGGDGKIQEVDVPGQYGKFLPSSGWQFTAFTAQPAAATSTFPGWLGEDEKTTLTVEEVNLLAATIKAGGTVTVHANGGYEQLTLQGSTVDVLAAGQGTSLSSFNPYGGGWDLGLGADGTVETLTVFSNTGAKIWSYNVGQGDALAVAVPKQGPLVVPSELLQPVSEAADGKYEVVVNVKVGGGGTQPFYGYVTNTSSTGFTIGYGADYSSTFKWEQIESVEPSPTQTVGAPTGWTPKIKGPKGQGEPEGVDPSFPHTATKAKEANHKVVVAYYDIDGEYQQVQGYATEIGENGISLDGSDDGGTDVYIPWGDVEGVVDTGGQAIPHIPGAGKIIGSPNMQPLNEPPGATGAVDWKGVLEALGVGATVTVTGPGGQTTGTIKSIDDKFVVIDYGDQPGAVPGATATIGLNQVTDVKGTTQPMTGDAAKWYDILSPYDLTTQMVNVKWDGGPVQGITGSVALYDTLGGWMEITDKDEGVEFTVYLKDVISVTAGDGVGQPPMQDAAYVYHPPGEPFEVPTGWEGVKHLIPGKAYLLSSPSGLNLGTAVYLGPHPGWNGQAVLKWKPVAGPKTKNFYLQETTLQVGTATEVIDYAPPEPPKTLNFHGTWKVGEKKQQVLKMRGYTATVTKKNGEKVTGYVDSVFGASPVVLRVRKVSDTGQNMGYESMKVADIEFMERIGDNYYQDSGAFMEGKASSPWVHVPDPDIMGYSKMPEEFKPYLITDTTTVPTGPKPPEYIEHPPDEMFDVPQSDAALQHFQKGKMYALHQPGELMQSAVYLGAVPDSHGHPILKFWPYNPAAKAHATQLDGLLWMKPGGEIKTATVLSAANHLSYVDAKPSHLKLLKYHQQVSEKSKLAQPFTGYQVDVVLWDGSKKSGYVSSVGGASNMLILWDEDGGYQHVKMSKVKTIDLATESGWASEYAGKWFPSVKAYKDGKPQSKADLPAPPTLDVVDPQWKAYYAAAAPAKPTASGLPTDAVKVKSKILTAQNNGDTVTVVYQTSNLVTQEYTGKITNHGTEGFHLKSDASGYEPFIQYTQVTSVTGGSGQPAGPAVSNYTPPDASLTVGELPTGEKLSAGPAKPIDAPPGFGDGGLTPHALPSAPDTAPDAPAKAPDKKPAKPPAPFTPIDHDPYADPKVPYVLPTGEVEVLDEGWKKYQPKKGGSNPGGFFQDPAGDKWYVKIGMKKESYGQQQPYLYDDRSKNEALAASLYHAAGVPVPRVELVDVRKRKNDLEPGSGGATAAQSPAHLGIKSEIVGQSGEKVTGYDAAAKDKDFVAQVKAGFAVDAWLGNWDVLGTGNDNILSVNGTPYRVDVGGTMMYRAQGGLKGEEFTYDVKELQTMRGQGGVSNSSTALFGQMSDAEVRDSFANTVAKVTDREIDAMVDGYALSEGQGAILKDKLKQRRLDMAEKLGVNLPDHPEFNFAFMKDHPDLAPMGFGSQAEYDHAVEVFGSHGALVKVNAAMTPSATGFGNVAQAMVLADRVYNGDPDTFIRVAKAMHWVEASNGYHASDIAALNEQYEWDWTTFATVVEEVQSGKYAEVWKPVDWVPPEKWEAPWSQDPPHSFDPWLYSDWKALYEASPELKAKWDEWMKESSNSHKAAIADHVSGLTIDPEKFPVQSDGVTPSREQVEINNLFRAHVAQTRHAFYGPTAHTSGAEMAKQASAAWGHPFSESTLSTWASNWGGSANTGGAKGLQWAALERYGFDLKTVTTDGVKKPKGSKGVFFKVYNPGMHQWITLSFSNDQYAYLADYLSSDTTRQKYLAALAGWNYGAIKQWSKAGVEKIAVLRGTEMSADWCEQNGVHVYSKEEIDALDDVAWSDVTADTSQRGVASFTVKPTFPTSGGVHGSGEVYVVWRGVFGIGAALGAHGGAYPSMGEGGGEGEVMMPAGFGYQVIAYRKNANGSKIAKFLGEGVKWNG